ncbi:MAG TPA: chorismate-binding protein, partial [Agromyces sp.]|nr:chorismate-binding protein [Agromyces sp.]
MPRRVRSRLLPQWREPGAVFRARFADAPYAVWLDGGADAVSGMSVLASAHAGSQFVTAGVAPATVTRSTPMSTEASEATLEASVFEVLGEGLTGYSTDEGAAAAVAGPLGWFGWFGYELGGELNDVPTSEAETPDAAFLFVDRAIVFDHAVRSIRLIWLEGDPAEESDVRSGEAWADEVDAAIAQLGEPPVEPATDRQPTRPAPAVHWRHDSSRYTELIAQCQAAIIRGDAYQLCLTNRVDIDVRPDPAATYLALRASSPSHHGGYLRFGEFALLSASPEQFLLVTADGVVSTKPMKGTRPRGVDAAEDEALRRELIESEKERAENLMIVDLMRNDLGRVAELGTVSVPSLLEVEEYPHVHQLVSTVQARLRH